ncbi:component of SufBCD complex [Antarcticimicrobium sediminis]|uniref:Component of SufBCD complex n=1 Tax=Antarcticimicrobium sediminis TaxID=2546227 RepID=A0A4R5ETX8_9RHOB|nr:component of SufBCD complex [Antarcticimicrobium sediminis]TDE38351.1 component of SufBCD complex [Antarcticimicrobium sediminis]
MDWYSTVFELIDMRSFSNLWFWIALAVAWSSASHWVLGVPYDLVLRARRVGGQAERDLEDITRVNVNRVLYVARVSGPWLMGIGTFLLSSLGILGFFYGVEFAQAVFLLGLPMSGVAALNTATARRIERDQAHGPLLYKRLARCRVYTQMIGMASIFVTALWGMYQNLSLGAF